MVNPAPDSDRDPTARERPANLLDVPTRLFDRYRVKHQLGRGGMGVVLLALDEELGVLVAIKLIPDSVVRDTEAIIDLKREVLRGMALLHPNIVRTHNLERDATRAAIIMEYVEGQTLAERKAQQAEGCFGPAEVLPWLEQLCPVLDYAHNEAKIAHRDLKPGNIIATRENRIKVADFGISSQINNSLSRLSGAGKVSGTPPYMSPQQALGERPSHLDDIYSLGATIYELLTGKPPFFRGDILAQVLHTTPPPMTERLREFNRGGGTPLPPIWEQTVAACLAKEPAERPQNAGQVLARLKGQHRDESQLATQTDGAISLAQPPAPELVQYSFRPVTTPTSRRTTTARPRTGRAPGTFQRWWFLRRFARGLWSVPCAIFGALFRGVMALQLWLWLSLGALCLTYGVMKGVNYLQQHWHSPAPSAVNTVADTIPVATPLPPKASRPKAPIPTPLLESWRRNNVAGLALDLPAPVQNFDASPPGDTPGDVTVDGFKGQMGHHTIYVRHIRSALLSDSEMRILVGFPSGDTAATAGIQILRAPTIPSSIRGLSVRRSDYVWTTSKPRICARCVLLNGGGDAWLIECHAPENDPDAERLFMRIVSSAQLL